MRLNVSGSGNSKSFYIIKSVKINGKNTSKVVEKLEGVHAKLSARQKWLQFKKIFTCLFKKLPDSFK